MDTSVAFLLLCGAASLEAVSVGVHKVCPTENHALRSVTKGEGQVSFKFHSQVPFDSFIFWVDMQGNERSPTVLGQGETFTGHTYPGHIYRVRSYHNILLGQYTVPEGGGKATIESCGEVDEVETMLYEPERAAEYEALSHNHSAPCYGPSSNWSCIRVLTDEEYANRDPTQFGFIDGENLHEEVGYQIDNTYTSQIPAIPRVSADGGPGFRHMTIPEPLRKPLLDWYETNKHKMGHHESVSGYTNNDKIPMHKLNLDQYPEMRALIAKEMQNVLQWWTKMHLRHTSTYGVRVYHRGSMLIDHVDRMETHVASAVIQVSQDVDRDGGWPLEVLLPNKKVGEVYLQPGEMVLYEGAWLRHGRPMRFKGNNFANIFTHFSPIDWRGPNPYPPRTDLPLPMQFHGYMPGRCDTLADLPGLKGACHVNEIMSKWDTHHDHEVGLHPLEAAPSHDGDDL